MKTRTLFARLILSLLVSLSPCLPISWSPQSAHAATGCNYPTSLDTFVDKIAGDFLTIADVNTFRCAIEKLESGPLRPNDGSAGAPAYAFRTSANTGLFLSAANTVDVTAGGVRAASFVTVGSGVNYLLFSPSATGNPVVVQGVGSDTDVGIQLVSKGTGPIVFSRNAGVTEEGRISSGTFLFGTTLSTGAAPGDTALRNTGMYHFANVAGTSVANYGVGSDASDNLALHVPDATDSINFSWGGTLRGWMQSQSDGMGLVINSRSSADHAAPGAGAVVIFQRDVAGKGQIAARFPSGVVQVIATEP